MAQTTGETESTPLLPPAQSAPSSRPSRSSRTVTFNPHTTVATIDDGDGQIRRSGAQASSSTYRPTLSSSATQPVLSVINDKLRRRNSHHAPMLSPTSQTMSKVGPQRTTKTAQKLKILPNPDVEEDQESGREVYSQFTRIKDPMARRDAARLGKADRERLPRVTAYCTASSYNLEGLMKFLKGRGRRRGAAPKLLDECIYTPYRYPPTTADKMMDDFAVRSSQAPLQERRYSDSDIGVNQDNRKQRLRELDGLDPEQEGEEEEGDHDDDDMLASPDGRHRGGFFEERTSEREGNPEDHRNGPDLDATVHTPEIFLFSYGTVVVWGMTVAEEGRFLKEISKFEAEKLAPDDVEVENFNFYYTKQYQARIYNDFINLREKKNYMVKLAISHALSQSVKTSLFEDLVDNTIDATKDIPEQIALTGNVNLTRRQILMQVGQLFILRINIHLQGSVLDSPELMWAEPQLDPVYQAVRSYLEMDQRVGLLTERLDVIGDLLSVLKDQLTHTHGEYLEWIVIVLIAAEIVVAAVNIVVDLYAGVG
ncbi:MAG: hypothetical protein M1815_001968 [Lichina confinis]|nr:MAG: hypothetical protein M1815_001968 [Lichina confinis]